jgi:hypothetical protein
MFPDLLPLHQPFFDAHSAPHKADILGAISLLADAFSEGTRVVTEIVFLLH